MQTSHDGKTPAFRECEVGMALLGTRDLETTHLEGDACLPRLASLPALREKHDYKRRVSNPIGRARLVADTRTSDGPKLGGRGAWSGPGGALARV